MNFERPLLLHSPHKSPKIYKRKKYINQKIFLSILADNYYVKALVINAFLKYIRFLVFYKYASLYE